MGVAAVPCWVPSRLCCCQCSSKDALPKSCISSRQWNTEVVWIIHPYKNQTPLLLQENLEPVPFPWVFMVLGTEETAKRWQWETNQLLGLCPLPSLRPHCPHSSIILMSPWVAGTDRCFWHLWGSFWKPRMCCLPACCSSQCYDSITNLLRAATGKCCWVPWFRPPRQTSQCFHRQGSLQFMGMGDVKWALNMIRNTSVEC